MRPKNMSDFGMMIYQSIRHESTQNWCDPTALRLHGFIESWNGPLRSTHTHTPHIRACRLNLLLRSHSSHSLQNHNLRICDSWYQYQSILILYYTQIISWKGREKHQLIFDDFGNVNSSTTSLLWILTDLYGAATTHEISEGHLKVCKFATLKCWGWGVRHGRNPITIWEGLQGSGQIEFWIWEVG